MVDDQELARRSDDPLDAHFAANMSRLREAAGLSQAELVQKLRESGWTNVHPTTISRIEKRERPVRLSEAARIAAVLGQDVSHMMVRPIRAGAEEEVDRWIERMAKSYNQVGEGVYSLMQTRRVLRAKLREFSKVVEREGDGELRVKLVRSAAYLGLRADKAVAAGREAYKDRRVHGTPDFIAFYGVSPSNPPDFVDEEDINATEA